MPGPWQWDDRAFRYRDTATGRFISQRRAVTLRDYYIESKKAEMDDLSRRLLGRDINIQQWVLEMRRTVKETYVNEYMLGRGGRNNMTQADWGRVGGLLQNQYRYVNRFAQDIDSERVRGGQISTRARMYVDSATQAFERAKVQALGLPSLPAYPGDGQTVCLSNCQCHWDIEQTDSGWSCTWVLGEAEHCPDCLDNASQWNPLEIVR